VESIVARHEAVDELYNNVLLREELRESLSDIQDMERLMSRIVIGSANGRDLIGLAISLEILPALKATLESVTSPSLVTIREDVDSLEHVSEIIRTAIVDDPPTTVKDGGLIKKGYNEELDILRSAATDGRDWIANLEATEREKTGIRNLKVGYNSVFGYYIEVSKSNLSRSPFTGRSRRLLKGTVGR
jgi:DNA mismatch repair protein MutS